MARISKTLDYIQWKGIKIECFFCGNKILNGGMWSGTKDIFVGECCAWKLLQFYKDVIADNTTFGILDIEYFENSIDSDIERVIINEIKTQESIIKRREEELKNIRSTYLENKSKYIDNKTIPKTIKDLDAEIMNIALEIVQLRKELQNETDKRKRDKIQSQIDYLLDKQKRIENRYKK